MKLTVGDIRFSASGPVNVLATVDVESGESLSPICSISVTAPMVEGQAIRDYDEYLKNKAREVITKMYKEIVSKHCSEHSIARGNQQYGSFQDAVDAGESKAFKVEHGKITINTSQVESISPSSKDNLEERVALLEKHLKNAGMHTSGVNQECDGSLVMRDADGSVRVRMNAERQTDSAINIKVDFPKMGSTIDKMEMKNKPDNGEERDFYGLDISYKKTLNSDIVIRGLVDVEKNSEEPTIHLLYSEDYNEQSSFSDFYSRAEKYARDVYRKIKASD
ncbi:hypothetical protein FKY29_26135 [Salmonella enterica]|nr:hypothetical protein [Salmonella enterica]ECM3181178.1 hypothetical protein [Salmonella enterica subsp. enterica serovar Newport]